MLDTESELTLERRRSLLIICNDVVGNKMAGPAIRCVELAKAASLIFDTTLAAETIESGYEAPFNLLKITRDRLKKLALNSELVIVQGDLLVRYPFLKEVPGVLVADLYCPIPLEYHQVSDAVDMSVRLETSAYLGRILSEQLAYADYFLCASEIQRDFWLGALTIANRINGLRWKIASRANINDLIITLPFGLEDDEPKQIKKPGVLRTKFNIPNEHFVAIWGGGIYEWFDPLTIIHAISEVNKNGLNIHLVFLGVKHPNEATQQHNMCERAVSLARQLDLLDNFVHFNFGWVEYSLRHEYLLDADIGVSAHFGNPETRFSFRTRMLDYLWCDRPIITTCGDYFGHAVRDNILGVSTGYENIQDWVDALTRLSQDSEFYRDCSLNIVTFKDQFRWKNCVRLFLDLAEHLQPSLDRVYARKRFRVGVAKPSLLTRLRHVYFNGGFRLIWALMAKRLLG